MNILQCSECHALTTDAGWAGHVQWHIATVALTMKTGGFTDVAAWNGAQRSFKDVKFTLLGSFTP